MENRKISINARPTFQFIKLVEDFISFANTQLQGHSKQKNLRPLLATLDSLSRTIQDPSGRYGVKVALQAFEELRNKRLGTPDSLDKQYDRAIKEKQAADDAYNQLPQQHEEYLNKQKRLKNATVEDMSFEELVELGLVAKKNQDLIIAYEDLDLKLSTKHREFDKLNTKIQKHCCGGALCNEEDLIKLRNIDHEIKVIIELQTAVKKIPDEPERTEEKIRHWNISLNRIRNDIEKKIDGYEDERKKAQLVVAEATKKINKISQRIDANLLDQCRIVDQDKMFDLVHLRARIANFYRLVDKVYKENNSTKLVLDSLTSAKNNWLDKFNKSLGAIYYPVITGRNGMSYYSTYVEWTKTHQQAQLVFESAEYSPNEYIAEIVPEIAIKKSKQTQTSVLGTAHDFFPAVNRSKIQSHNTTAPTTSPTISTGSSSS